MINFLYERYDANIVFANTLDIDIISTDYGSEKYENGLTKCLVFRGTDIQNIKEGTSPEAPTRYISPKKLENKNIIENDILIEISGGTLKQSTGRTCFITNDFLQTLCSPSSTAGFSRILRCKNRNVAISLYLALTTEYTRGFFFAFENGSSGIRNLNVKKVLDNLEVKALNDVQCDELCYYINQAYKLYKKKEKLIKIKQQFLEKFF